MKPSPNIIYILCILSLSIQAHADEAEQSSTCNESNKVVTNNDLSEKMLNWQDHVTDKTKVLLDARKDGSLCNKKMTVGGMFKASFMAEWANKPGKFSIWLLLDSKVIYDSSNSSIEVSKDFPRFRVLWENSKKLR